MSSVNSNSSEDELIIEDNNDEEESIIIFNKDEIRALLKECMHSYISYENPVATDVIRRMVAFVDET